MNYLHNTGLVRMDQIEWNLVKSALLFAGYRYLRCKASGKGQEIWTPDRSRCISQQDDLKDDFYVEASCLSNCPNVPGALEAFKQWEKDNG